MPGGAKSVPVRSLIVEGGYYLTATQQLNSSLAWDLTELARTASRQPNGLPVAALSRLEYTACKSFSSLKLLS